MYGLARIEEPNVEATNIQSARENRNIIHPVQVIPSNKLHDCSWRSCITKTSNVLQQPRNGIIKVLIFITL